MSMLDRLRRRPAPLRDDELLAVPLTPAEAGQLVQALREDDRLTHVHRPDRGGSGFCRSEAESVARMAGIAAALGDPYVPHPVQSLHMYDYVLMSLQQWAPRAASTAAFAQLLTRMQILAGMAGVRRWAVRYDPAVAGMRWAAPPTGVPGDSAPATRDDRCRTDRRPPLDRPAGRGDHRRRCLAGR